MKNAILLIVFLFFSSPLFAQQLPPHLADRMEYPVFDFHPWVGVVKTDASALSYDQKLENKIVIDIVDAPSDSAALMNTLREVARTYNLHVANGVPEKKLAVAVVIHGSAIYGVLKNERYKERNKVDNPNLEVLKLFKDQGIDLYICAQVLAFRNIDFDDVADEIQLAVSAKTALTTLDQMGYSYMKISER
jgi:intracellular sulfur oxidation DsrE/DsrF family protein